MKGSTATPGCERGGQSATRALWQTMVELGEDPARYRSLLRDVVNSYPPASPLELRLCEDITRCAADLPATFRRSSHEPAGFLMSLKEGRDFTCPDGFDREPRRYANSA